MGRKIKNLAGGEAFKKLINKKNMTPYQLAKKSGVSKSHISLLASGMIVCPEDETLQKLAEPLDRTVDELRNIFTRALLDSSDSGREEDRGNSTCSIMGTEVTIANRCENWDGAPDVSSFQGRTDELDKLKRWIVCDRIRVLALIGQGGIGKSAVSVKLAQDIKDKFEYVIWRSLHHCPPVEHLLADLLQFFPHQQQTHHPATDTTSISRLMNCLRSHRCLVILDDWQTVLCSGDLAGHYRQEYQNYSELLRRVGEEPHQSCVVICSREKPIEIVSLASSTKETGSVRFLKLSGLPIEDAKAILQAESFSGSENGLEELIWQYGGNPSALKIISKMIKSPLFNGSISNFLEQSSLLHGDIIANHLTQQFQRLSPLEKEIMYWLAIEQTPVSLADLRSNIWFSVRTSDLINSLEFLERRCLLEIITKDDETLFTLQPVLAKYVINQLIEQVCKNIFAVIETHSLEHLGLLRSHTLVQEPAPDTVKEIQDRLILKRVKDKLPTILGSDRSIEEQLNEIVSIISGKSPTVVGYTQVNMRNLLAALEAERSIHD
jgi:transcriptional regulator with XRE-family HTH domain